MIEMGAASLCRCPIGGQAFGKDQLSVKRRDQIVPMVSCEARIKDDLNHITRGKVSTGYGIPECVGISLGHVQNIVVTNQGRVLRWRGGAGHRELSRFELPWTDIK